jgi:hypothetical protein
LLFYTQTKSKETFMKKFALGFLVSLVSLNAFASGEVSLERV